MSSGSIRIIQLPEKSSVNTDDYMAVDSSANGTKKVKFTDLLDDNLSVQNKAADASATGEAIGELNTNINNTNTRIDNIINTQTNAEVTTLWTGTLENYNQEVTLSDNVSNYDFIDIYVSQLDYKFIRRPVNSLTGIQIQGQNMLDSGSTDNIQFWEGGLNISGNKAKITKANSMTMYGYNTYTKPTGAVNTSIPSITRIDGVKIGHVENDEIVDARVGADGVTYDTLGNAIRTQFTDLNDDIIELKGNPNLIPKSGLIWQFDNTLNTNKQVRISGSRFSIKPECWIPLKIGETYDFYYQSDTYKFGLITCNDSSTSSDKGWMVSGQTYTFTATHNYVCLVLATISGSNVNFADFLNNYPQVYLKIHGGVVDSKEVTVEQKEEIYALDIDKTIQGMAEVSNGSIVIETDLYRASYNEIIDISNVEWLSLMGNIFDYYDVSILIYNSDYTYVYDSGWITTAQRKFYLPTRSNYFVIRFKKKASGLINYACLLYNNELLIGFDVETKTKERIKTSNPFNNINRTCHIAHRGYQAIATENSIPAFIGAKTIGFDACETDIQSTSDGVLVCMHDATVDRTTNGTGRVTQMTYAEIEELVIDHDSTYTDDEMRVPTLDEFLFVCKKYGLIPVIELKSEGFSNENISTLINTLYQYGMEERACIISFSSELLSYLRKADSDIYLMPLLQVDDYGNRISSLTYNKSGINSGTFTFNDSSKEAIKSAHDMGLFVGVNIVVSQEDADNYIKYGVDAITSNNYFG